MDGMANTKRAIKVSYTTLTINIVLSAFKLVAGFLSGSAAIVSDGIHSFSDSVSTLVVIVGVKFAAKKSDDSHPYGHERIENIAAIALGVILLYVSVTIMISAVEGTIAAINGETTAPTYLAVIAAVVSIVVKELMYRYTKRAAKATKSTALLADAWHQRSDALSSIGSLLGVVGSMLGLLILDPIASAVIAVIILKVAIDIIMKSLNEMTDAAMDKDSEAEIREIISGIPQVLSIDLLKTRRFASKFYVDVEIGADASLSIKEGHDIAQHIHDEIEQRFPDAKHCMVHVNPYENQCELK